MRFIKYLAIFVFVFGLSQVGRAYGDAIQGPSCTVSGKVVDAGSEVPKTVNADKDTQYPYIKLLVTEVIVTKRFPKDDIGCSFIKENDVFKFFLPEANLLAVGDKVKAGIEEMYSMMPNGKVSEGYLRWIPIYRNGESTPLKKKEDSRDLELNGERVMPARE